MQTFARILISMAVLLLSAHIAYASSGITYHGRLLNPEGTPSSSTSVQFKMQIRTPGIEDCLLYEEIQNHDLSATNGMFAISLGDGSGTRQDSNTWSLFDALSNRKNFSFAVTDCVGPNSYAPATTDNRRFKVLFNDGSFPAGTWEALPLQTINYIPMSIESYAVGGFPASSLLRVETAGTLGTTTPLTSTQYSEILSLVNGSSSQYEQDGELNGSALPTISSGESVRWTGTAWQSFTPITSETDPNVEAFAKSSLPTCATGEVLKSDGTTLSCVTDAGGWSAVDATATVKGIVNVPTTGGLEVTSGAIGLPDVVTGGTYTKVTVDDKGRVTTGANITGSDITSGTIGGSTSISTTGTVSAASMSVRQIDLYDSDNTHHISFLTPATTDLTSNYDLVFPSTLGSANQVLGMNAAGDALENKSITAGSGVTITHSAGGIAIAATGSGGTVTSVSGTSPISVATGTSTPVISLDDAGTAGTYGSSTEVPVFTTDAKGRVTSVTETTISGISPVGSTLATGQAWIGDGSGEAQARFIGINDLKTSIAGNANQIPTTCAASQTMTYSAVTDVFSCANISITASQVSDLDMDDYVEVAGDTMTGALTVNGRIEAAGGMLFNQGSGATDNLIYVGSSTAGDVDASFGFFAGGVGSLSGNDGPYMIARGNAFSAISNQRGMLNFYAGSPTTPTGNEGSINFATGTSDQTRMTVSRVGNVGIGTTDPSTKLDVSGTIQIANGGEACSVAADGGMIRYNGGDLQFCNESAWQTLGVSGAGLTSLNGQTGSTQTFATPGISGNAPNWSSGSDAHTLNIPMASASGVTAGLISKTDYDAFNSKLGTVVGSSLADGSVWIGDSSGDAQVRNISGDISLTNTGAVSVTKIQGEAVSASTPSSGHVLLHNGTQWEPTYFGVDDLKTSLGASQFSSASCTSSQTLTWSSLTDAFSCANISIANTQVSGLGTAATKDVGTSAGNVVMLDGSSRLPAVDGSQLANLPTATVPDDIVADTVTLANGIKIGTVSTACDGTMEGTIRYNSTSKKMEFCNGMSWGSISAGTIANITLGSPSSSLVQSGPVEFVVTYSDGTDSATISLDSADITLGGTATTGCSVTGVTGSGLTRTIEVDNCTGTGSVNISIASGTADSTTGDAAASAGPSTSYNVDNAGPNAPTGITLGSVPGSHTSSPTISYTAPSDVGGSTVASYQVQILKTSDSSIVYAWNTHTSGNAVMGLTLESETEYAVYIKAIDALGNVGTSSIAEEWTTVGCTAGSQVFAYTGSDQSFTVPDGCTSITAKAWGAGGGGGDNTAGVGGAGGYSIASLSVTSGEVLTVIVGGGGIHGDNQPGGFGGGGEAGFRSAGYESGSGGGRSAIRRSSTELFTAGGGGGAGPCGNSNGGPGGGLNGVTGLNRENAGGGGSQTTGGFAGGSGATPGTAFLGGNGLEGGNGGGGGGGGYYGGGGGGGCGAGGGGSGFASGGTTTAGSDQAPPQTSDPDYVANVGTGGNNTQNGGNGLVVLSWAP